MQKIGLTFRQCLYLRRIKIRMKTNKFLAKYPKFLLIGRSMMANMPALRLIECFWFAAQGLSNAWISLLLSPCQS